MLFRSGSLEVFDFLFSLLLFLGDLLLFLGDLFLLGDLLFLGDLFLLGDLLGDLEDLFLLGDLLGDLLLLGLETLIATTRPLISDWSRAFKASV